MRFRCKGFLFTRLLVVVLTTVSVFAPITSAQEQSVILRPGIVIDQSAKVVYAMTPEGITAIDLTSGAKQWTTTAAVKPLAVSGNQLISQIEPKTRTNRLELVTLDTKERGSVKMRSVAELPNSVRVALGQTLEGTFDAEARMQANTALVTWKFERRPLRGRLDESSRTGIPAVPQNQPTGIQAPTEGALRVDLTTGAVSTADASFIDPISTRDWVLAIDKKVSGAPSTQYESADKRHVMASERIADDKTWAKYRWIVFDRATNRRVGEFRTHLAFAPFVVRDSTLIYETTPYVNAGKSERAKLRGINLVTGQETWNVEVREVAFRGPYPP